MPLLHTRFQPGDQANVNRQCRTVFNGFHPRGKGKPLKRLGKKLEPGAATRLKSGENESATYFSFALGHHVMAAAELLAPLEWQRASSREHRLSTRTLR